MIILCTYNTAYIDLQSVMWSFTINIHIHIKHTFTRITYNNMYLNVYNKRTGKKHKQIKNQQEKLGLVVRIRQAAIAVDVASTAPLIIIVSFNFA